MSVYRRAWGCVRKALATDKNFTPSPLAFGTMICLVEKSLPDVKSPFLSHVSVRRSNSSPSFAIHATSVFMRRISLSIFLISGALPNNSNKASSPSASRKSSTPILAPPGNSGSRTRKTEALRFRLSSVANLPSATWILLLSPASLS